MASRQVGVGEALIRTLLAAVVTGLIYGMYGLLKVAHLELSIGIVAWVLVAGATTLPVALASAIAGNLASRLRHRSAFFSVVILGIALAIVSAYLFSIYMTKLSPASNWSRDWPLPAGSSLIAFSLGILRWPTFDRPVRHSEGENIASSPLAR